MGEKEGTDSDFYIKNTRIPDKQRQFFSSAKFFRIVHSDRIRQGIPRQTENAVPGESRGGVWQKCRSAWGKDLPENSIPKTEDLLQGDSVEREMIFSFFY